ncbi:hemagglutinin repeat-containing protein [Chromobacterium rhizoryzae]|uniref:Filamentous hemagglutinin N-terminal domain-containing protein n=1 Tax=Chromobacterium rhizoryzae TaxID=1778675 RepID=A0AAD0W7D7_9NEIS|nr:hemagglutinin repeat-containing protein [Chromobacterium rhizoryzae]AXT46119.1 filamentous hemagglutinin N-terminal domain-containing protein [Chromobacterium rhizoryzae]
MNKTLYRIIFNQARGQLMAVQETASGQGKGGGRGQTAAGARFAAARGFGFKLCALWVGVSLGSVALAADIVADPGAAAGKRPTVIQANSGLPVVQIAVPTAAGVSHNQYQQFNVGPKGVVLNNSAQVVNTQLAGYVGGNPNLAGGSARIILNEVTHANPSQLNGYLEVAGQRAQVVVANPWGISCSGCGFINTQQAMLSTGTPQLNALGALTGFQVNGGAVSISGTGLNAGNVDKFAIISRALQVNAELHAKQLDLVLGRNQVDADTLQARPLAADGSAAPAFALDVAQLGGMYANAIRLVGTEAGVGVNQQGEMAARAGDLQLTSAGDLLLKGKTFSQQDMKLNSGGKLEHGGQTRSQGALQVAAVGAAQLDGSLTAGGALDIEAAAVAGKGSVAAGAQADGKLGETGALTLRSRAGLDFHGELLAGGDASIQAGNAQLQGAVVGASHGDLRVTADGDLNASQAKLGAKGLARLQAGEGIQLRQGALSAGQLELQAKALDNRGGLIAQSGAAAGLVDVQGLLDNRDGVIASQGKTLTVNAAAIDNRHGEISHAGEETLRVSADKIDNREQGKLHSDAKAEVKAAEVDNAQGRLTALQGLELNASGALRNDGLLGSDGQLKLTAGQLENGVGLIQAGKDLQLTAASVSNADKGQILALGKEAASSLEISGQLNNQGKIAGNAGLDVNAADIDNHGGTLQSAGELKLEKQAGLNNDGGHIVAKDLVLKAGTLSNQGGEVFAQQALDAQLRQLNNAKGSLIGSQSLSLSASEVLRNDGLLGSDGQLKLTVGQLENGAGLIQAGRDLQLTAASVNNADKGQILALGKDTASSLEISGQLNNQGKIAGNTELKVNAADIDNHVGTLQSAGRLKLEKQAGLNNDGGHIVAKDLNLKADTLSNQGGEVFAQQQLDAQLGQLNNAKGSLIGSQGFTLSASEVLRNDGLLGSDGTFKLTVGQLENGAGLIQAGKDLQLTAASVNNADQGQILALGKDTASNLEISGQLNNQGKIAGNAQLDINAADIDNHGGTLQSAGQLKLEKQASLNNDGGHIVAKDLSLKAGMLSNQGGEVFAQQQLDAQLRQLNNAKGSLIGSQGFTLSASEVLHNDGLLGSDGTFKLTAGQLENGAGLIQAGKDLQLTAASVNNADKGQILALGKDVASSLEISGQLNNQGKIAGNTELKVNGADIDNHGGTLQSAGELKLEKQAGLNNDGGHIVAKGLNLKADTLSNQGGEIRHLGQSMAQWQVRQRLDNQQGTLFSNGGLTLAAQSLNNQQGSLSSLGAQSLQLAQGLDNQGGALVSGQGLQLQLGAALNNQGGTVQAESLQLHAASLGNQGGSIKALGAGDGKVAIGGTLDNSAQGLLAGNGRLEVSALALDNRQGVLQSAAKLDVQVAQLAQNQGGKIQAGQLQLKAAELNNQQGLLSQAGDSAAKLELSGQLDNGRQGKVLSNGQLQVTAADLLNAGGTLSSQGDLQLSASGALDNRQGALGSNGALKLDSASVDNAGGLIQAGRTLSLDSGSLLNQGGKLLALGGGDSRVTLSGQLNNGGQIAGNGDWRIKAQGLDNAGGSLLSVGSLGIDAVMLGNSGSFLAGKDLNLTLASDFIHVAGSKLQANGKLSISSSGNLINSGQLQAGGDLVLNGVSWTNSGEVNAGGKLSAALSQALSNSGKLSAGALQLNAASVLNTHSITGGDISIQAASLDNGGNQGLIASAGNMALDIGQTLNNHDGSWLYSQGDMRIGKAGAAAGQVINHVATLQSDGNLFVDASGLRNESAAIALKTNSLERTEQRSLYKYPVMLVGVTDNCGHDGRGLCSPIIRPYVGKFDFKNGVDVSWKVFYQSCDRSCGPAPYYLLNYRVVKDDVQHNLLTVERKVEVPDSGGRIIEVKTEQYYYISKKNDRYVYLVGFDPNKHLFPVNGQVWASNMLTDARVMTAGEMESRLPPNNDYRHYVGDGVELSVFAREGKGQVVDLSSISPNLPLANPGEFARVTKINEAVDVAVEGERSGGFYVGGDARFNVVEGVNEYGDILVGGNLFESGGVVKNVGQNLNKTVVTSVVSTVANECQPGRFCFGTHDVSLPIKTVVEKVGSLDAVISTGQKLTLQAPIISNGKASQLDISLTTGNNQPAAAVVNTAAGKALTQADGDAASAGKKLGGKPLDALASAQALAGPLTGAQAAADLQKSAVGSQAGAQWDGTKTSVLPQQVLLESAGTKAANPVADGYSLPNNGLFQTRPAPQQPYLVETDPRFTQYNNFISSDYLLKQLGYDPSRVEKRLGDGFYEQQLVSRAVTELTGKRFIGGNANATQQYQQLMSQGAEYAKQFQLTPGVALSAEQMSRLTADMVWLVKQNVDGHDVLVPVVYLAKAQEQSLRGQGAVLAGSHMELLADGSLINSGTLKADNSLLAQAGDIRIEGGKVLAGGDLGLGARHDLSVSDDKQHSQAGSVIQAGSLQLQAGNDLKLQAAQLQVSGDAQLQAGRDLDIASRENRYSHAGNTGRSQYSYQQVDHVGSTLQVGGSLGFNAGHDLTLSGAEVKAGGKLLAVAGNELTLQSTLDSKQGQGSWNGWGWGAYSTLDQTRHATQLQAGGDMLLQAGGNLALNGSQAQAGGNLLALAGKQLTVQSEVNSRQDRLNVQMGSKGAGHSWQTDSLTVAGLASQGNLQLQAGGDAVLNGVSLGSHSALTLSAGQDIRLGAVATQSRSDNYYTNGDIHNNYDFSQHGSALSGVGGLTLNAGRDIATQAANITSDGQSVLLAGRDIELGTADNRHSDYHKTVRSSGGMFNKKTVTDITSHDSTTAQQTLLSADAIVVKGVRDIRAVGAQIVANNDVALIAGRDITLDSAIDRARSEHIHIEKTSGMFGGSGGGSFGVTVGSRTKGLEELQTNASHVQGVVGSNAGSLLLQAGGKIDLIGTQLQAAKDIRIDGRDVSGVAVVDALDSRTLSYTESSGLRIGAKSTVSQAAANLMSSADRGSQVSDPRLKALYAAKAAYAAKDLSTMMQSVSQSTDKGGGLKGRVSIGYGYSREESESVSHVDVVKKAQAAAGGEIDIRARGDGSGENGDITLTGAALTANAIALNAARDLITHSQEAISSQESTYRKLDLEAGVYIGGSVGKGGGKGGIGAYGSAAMNQSSTKISSLTHEETTLDATGKVQVKTGRDASLTGTTVRGDSIQFEVGRNLTLTSEQDRDQYRQKSWSGQIEGRYAYGNDSGVDGSLSFSQTKSDWRSVQEQTGLFAGKGGFDVAVGGHSQLNGAVITSTADIAKNKLLTNSLGFAGLENSAAFSAVSFSASFSSGGDGMGGAPKGGMVMPGLGVPQQESKSSTTNSAIAGGSITVKQDQSSGQDSTAGLSRDTASAGGQLERIFDAKKVAEQQEFSRVLGEVGFRAVGDLSKEMGWKDGSPEKMALHALMGALQAKAGGGNMLAGMAAAGANEWIGSQVADYLQSNTQLDEPQRKAIQQWAAVATGAVVGGLSGGDAGAALSGGAVALDGEKFNRQLHPSQTKLVKEKAKQLAGKEGLSAKQWEARLLEQLAFQNSEMYISYRNDPQAEAILKDLQGSSGVRLDYRGTADYKNDALNLQYLPQMADAYAQLPRLNGRMNQEQFARYVGLVTGDFAHVSKAEQKQVVLQLQEEYTATFKQQLDLYKSGKTASPQVIQLDNRLDQLNKLLGTAEHVAVTSGAINESQTSLMQRAIASGLLFSTNGVAPKPQGRPVGGGTLVKAEPAKEKPDYLSASPVPAKTQTKLNANRDGESYHAETWSSLKAGVDQIRKQYPIMNEKGMPAGNAGVAEINVYGKESVEVKAHSRIGNSPEGQRDGFVSLPPPGERILTPYAGPFKGVPRESDTEFKILEAFAQKYRNDVGVRGNINLFTERPPCESCSKVIREQFVELFPNVEVRLYHGNGNVAVYKDGGVVTVTPSGAERNKGKWPVAPDLSYNPVKKK